MAKDWRFDPDSNTDGRPTSKGERKRLKDQRRDRRKNDRMLEERDIPDVVEPSNAAW
jgi:hypothetical protein